MHFRIVLKAGFFHIRMARSSVLNDIFVIHSRSLHSFAHFKPLFANHRSQTGHRSKKYPEFDLHKYSTAYYDEHKYMVLFYFMGENVNSEVKWTVLLIPFKQFIKRLPFSAQKPYCNNKINWFYSLTALCLNYCLG